MVASQPAWGESLSYPAGASERGRFGGSTLDRTRPLCNHTVLGLVLAE